VHQEIFCGITIGQAAEFIRRTNGTIISLIIGNGGVIRRCLILENRKSIAGRSNMINIAIIPVIIIAQAFGKSA
jgi:hypothetical protein